MKKILLLATMSLLAVGCKGHDKNPFSNAKEAIEDKDLQGKNFESECKSEVARGILTFLAGVVKTGDTVSVKSSREAYRFQGSNVTRTTVLFMNAGCDGEAYRLSETGTFNVTKNQKTNDGGYFIDLKYKKLTASVASAEGAVAANAISLCGISDWKAGQERPVSAVSAEKSCLGAYVPRTNNNVYRVDAGKVLMLGTDTMENAAPRPASLSNEKYTSLK